MIFISPTSFNSAPAGLEDVSKYPELFSTLMASGMWTLDDLKKLAGLNFLRVFREVERVCLYIKDITRCWEQYDFSCTYKFVQYYVHYHYLRCQQRCGLRWDQAKTPSDGKTFENM